jgi:hypothetical protein
MSRKVFNKFEFELEMCRLIYISHKNRLKLNPKSGGGGEN